ncbi:immunoglobulin domain-containing protein [Salmonella enterica subsp. enterica]|nr:immunoglobulin domain-containing protein [Salmonella enterica subsp. enterica]EJM7831431.1 immunoglobulin domain-containing protein [Salmonella enterica]EJT0199963.1 immunoglobulin domain-containing protein [Salmonella enterica]
MVDVIKRRTTGVDDANDDGQVEIVMENISPASFSTGLNDTTAVTAPAALTLTVAATGGQAPYSYQWFKDGNAISGATAATYTKTTTVAGTDSGTYKVVVQDGYGNIISDNTVVTVS